MTIRLSPALRKKCKTAAEERGMLLSQFLRFAAALVAATPAGGGLTVGDRLCVQTRKRNHRGEVISPMDEQGSR